MATKIVTKNSSTASAVPTAAQLVQGELAVNVADKRLYTENASGVIVEVGSNPYNFTANHDGSAKLTTTATGIDVTGNVALGDNGKATFGAGDDLQIYHDGSNSIIKDNGTGNLQIQGQNLSLEDSAGTRFFLGIQGGETRLYNQGDQKVSINTTGIDVTGTATMDGLTVGTTSNAYSAAFIISSATGESELRMGDTDTDAGSIAYTNSDDTMTFRAAAGARMTLDSTGIDVTGTATMDGLTVDGGAPQLNINSANPILIMTETDQAANSQKWGFQSETGLLKFRAFNDALSSAVTGLSISRGGDISFYEDTGTTAKLFWDASAESLGIGTSSPTRPLTVSKAGAQIVGEFINPTASQTARIYVTCGTQTGQIQQFGNTHATDPNTLRFNTTSGDITLAPSSVERVRVTAAGNVGIGTSSPATLLNTKGAALTTTTDKREVLIEASDDGVTNSAGALTGVTFRNSPTTYTAGSFNRTSGIYGINLDAAGYGRSMGLALYTSGIDGTAAEKMRIDSSGHAIIPAGVTLGTATGVYNAANTLDDYEEGTWTPTLGGGATATGMTGTYTKVGRLVTAHLHLENSTISGTPDYIVSGLPFTSAANRTPFAVTYFKTFNATCESLGGFVAGNGNTMQFLGMIQGSPWVTAPLTAGTGRYAFVTAVYQTA